jgi:hypothetical protein
MWGLVEENGSLKILPSSLALLELNPLCLHKKIAIKE